MNVNDITLIKAINPAAVNKQYSKAAGGEIEKKANAHITQGSARRVSAHDAEALAAILREVTASADTCIVPGVFRGSQLDSDFTVVTEEKLRELTGIKDKKDLAAKLHNVNGGQYAARLRDCIEQSPWVLLDFDDAPGIPDEWAAMDIAARLELFSRVVPGIDMCERIELRGSSNRVVNGTGGKPRSHAWIRVSHPEAIDTLRAFAAVEIVNKDIHFDMPIRSRKETDADGHPLVIGSAPRTVLDLSVWTPGRLVFCSQPDIDQASMPDYHVSDADITIVNPGAGLLDISGIQLPGSDARHRYKEVSGRTLSFSRANGKLHTYVAGVLSWDTEIIIKGRTLRFGDVVWNMQPGDRVRCEAPFRESHSEAGFIRVTDDYKAFAFDVGVNEKYMLGVPGRRCIKHDPKSLETALALIRDADDMNTLHGEVLERIKQLPGLVDSSVEHIAKAFQRRSGTLGERPGIATVRDMFNETKERLHQQALGQKYRAWQERIRLGDRVRIEWDDHQADAITKQVKARISAASADHVFDHGTVCSQVVMVPPQSVRMPMNSDGVRAPLPARALLRPYVRDTLIMRINRDVVFVEQKQRRLVSVPPNNNLVGSILADPSGLPVLRSIIKCPTFTLDGELVADAGYHPRTKVFVDYPAELRDAIPTGATREQAVEEVQWLLDNVFVDFPFETQRDSTAAIGFLLSAVMTPFLPAMPIFLADAWRPNTGKTLFCETVSRIVTGDALGANSYTTNEEEMEKKIISVLLEGHPMLLLDNLAHGTRFNSEALSKVSTSEFFDGRLLGLNKSVNLPSNVLVCLTGNNVAPIKDMMSRVISIRMNLPSNEQRVFKHPSLIDFVTANRSRILRSVLTVLQAFFNEGREYARGVKHFSRYPDWDQVVRIPLMWIGRDDLNEIFMDAAMDDELTDIQAAFMEATFNAFRQQPDARIVEFTVAELVSRVKTIASANWVVNDPLLSAVDDLMGNRPGSLNQRVLGVRLAKMKGQIAGGFKFDVLPKYAGSNKSRRYPLTRVAEGG